ncbi:MAG: molybdopterin-dependent oxidoreductase [Patescibacteria group bacterium]|jgi:DMSO/TMAO reductase YedYZ molybdopterin-dependent catalytic subunit
MTAFKRFIIIAMFLDFILLAGTGIIKFPEWQRYFLLAYDFLPASKISMIHDWSGIILFLLILIHLILKRRELKEAIVGKFKSTKGNANIIYIITAVAVGIIILAGVVAYFNGNYFGKSKPITLSGVEITEYRGEKLGSINDFRENSIKGPQQVDKDSYRLEISGLIETPMSYKYDDILKLPIYQKVIQLNCVEGWSVKALWEGVLVRDLLKDTAIKPEAKTIIFYAADGYSTSFPLEYVMQNNIIMADKLNGVVLPPERGFPFQLAAEQKWGYKWIKWITKIELSSDTDYKGFWESRGYNNNGDLNGSKFSQ